MSTFGYKKYNVRHNSEQHFYDGVWTFEFLVFLLIDHPYFIL